MKKPEIVSGLDPLFNPGSVAVVGASNNMNKWGFSTFMSLKNNFKGNLYAVNNRDKEIQGYPAFSRVTDIPDPLDLVVIVIPAEGVAGVMEDCVEKGVKASVIISAGFAETGPDGKALQDQVLAIARRGNIRFVGPNCMGLWSASSHLPAFMFPLPIMSGPLALVSQGGNVGGSLVIDAVQRGIGFEKYISCGCAADIQIEDYIEYLGHDDSVKVIMVYIEGLADGKRFVEKVRKVTRIKPVIALKPGRTLAAARAITSHSGALSGADSVYEAAFRKAGVLRVDTGTELLDVAIGLMTQPLPRGRNIVITTPGGSYGVMCADACASRGLNVISLPESAMESFNKIFPPRWSHGNPVDPAGDRNFIAYLKAPELLLKYPEVDAVIFMGFGSFSGISAMLATAGGEVERRMDEFKNSIQGLEEMARTFVSMLDSGDRSQIRDIIRTGLGVIFSPLMSSNASDLEEFLDTVSEAVTTDKMLTSSFFRGLRELFESVAEGNIDGTRMADIMLMIEPMLDALIDRWIREYDKPVITTTFTEESSRIGELGHFSYPNADRAANVLAKLVERREYLESAGE
jgi:succinyl-CoA synthetase alpha subunit